MSKRLKIADMVREFKLPPHVIRQLFDNGTIASAFRYPNQHRSIADSEVTTVRRKLVAAGYLPKDGAK